MPSAPVARKPTDLAHELFRVVVGKITGKKEQLKSEDARRSRSTGDLDQEDYMLIDYSAPTTSQQPESLPAHFDDCDRVPMVFNGAGGHLLPQTSSTRKMLTRGDKRPQVEPSTSQLHLAQLWFYPELSQSRAESILQRTVLVDGSFLIRTYEGRHFLSILTKKGTILHLLISCAFVRGEFRYRVDIDKQFKNLVDLVSHYQKAKGYVLPNKLKNGIARGLRAERRVEEMRTLKSKKHSI